VGKVNTSVGSGDERREVLQLKGEREDVRVGRRFLTQALIRLGWDDRVDDACLLLSELVANVALHARTGCSVVVSDTAGLLHVEVEDGSPVLPRVQHYSIDTTTGRGLRLVEKLAQSWGVERTPAGKKVWFVLDHAAAVTIPGSDTKSIAAVEIRDHSEPDLDDLLHRLGASDEDGLSLLSLLEPAL
jgi:anti-sigma regulatory factor (Ser/Thr protein kinase)